MKKTNAEANPAKLFFVSNSCWSIYNFRLDVIEYFIKAGYEIHIAATRDDFAMLLVNIGCKLHHIQFNNRRLNPVEDLKLFFILKALYKKIKPDLIFHYVIKPNIYGSFAASQLKIPSVAVITGLGYAFANRNWLSWFVIKLYKAALKNVHSVWMLNQNDKDLFLRKNIVDPQKTMLLQGEGINAQKFKPSSKKRTDHIFTFLMATRMLWSKGVGLFAEASKILHKKGLIFECQVIGFFEPNHPDSISLEQFENWKDDKIFNCLGFSENVIPFFENADCFVLPSYYQEGVPRSLLEAGAMQIPAITTNNDGCTTVIKDGINGFICEMNNAEDLAAKMEKILCMQPETLQEMGQRGREFVLQKFDVKFVIEQYVNLVDHLNLK
jgi:glycosyltransferase involved in cell wall biosynthesis